jgi:hypothetical protein
MSHATWDGFGLHFLFDVSEVGNCEWEALSPFRAAFNLCLAPTVVAGVRGEGLSAQFGRARGVRDGSNCPCKSQRE